MAGNVATAAAQPLQGSVEENTTNLRMSRSSAGVGAQNVMPQPAPSFRGQVGTGTGSGIVNGDSFNMSAADSGQYLSGGTAGGQDEWWINWDSWRHRVVDAVWAPLRGIMMYGQTRVDYNVTRDHHIRITNVYTPDPTGRSARILVNEILHLDGNPILEFPQGSQQQVHHNWNKVGGPPILTQLQYMMYLPGGTERVVRQW